MKRVVIYVRVSDPRQAEADKVSLGEQEERCRYYCASKNYSVVAVYQDAGKSGLTKKRPQFQAMLRDAKQDKFDVIVAWKGDRLARGIYPAAALFEALENTTINIETVVELFDRTTFEVRAVVGRIEVENMAQRTQMGREGNISKLGHNHPKPPFGYDYHRESKRWTTNDFEAKWVRQIFDWYIASISVYEIARRLNNAGVPTKNRSSLGWTAQKVSQLAALECYTGVAYYNKRQRTTGKKKDRGEWVPMLVPAIISQETWQAAQGKRANNKRFSPRNTKAVYVTQHIMECEECGKSFLIHSGSGQPRLVCRGMTLHPHLYNCREPKTLFYQPIADRLWQGVVGILESEGGLEAAIQSRIEYVKERKETLEEQLGELAHKLSSLEGERDIVITGFRKGFYDEESLQRQLSAIHDDKAQSTKEIDSLLADLRLLEDAQTVGQKAKELIPLMKARLHNELTDKEKYEIIQLLVRRALLDGMGNLTIEFKIPRPNMSFASATSPHAGLPGYIANSSGVGGLASH
jgi:site-specific DNA recombinase